MQAIQRAGTVLNGIAPHSNRIAKTGGSSTLRIGNGGNFLKANTAVTPVTTSSLSTAQSVMAANTATAGTQGTTSGWTASSTTGSSSDITSSDFLSLLVTEMKNQDPTQPTDPTTYVQQLVGVNSLQQLIAINQDLGG